MASVSRVSDGARAGEISSRRWVGAARWRSCRSSACWRPAAPVWAQSAKPQSTPPAIVDNFSIHVLLRDGRGSALFRRVAHDRLLPDGP
jgi:hypothetical protein